MTSRFDAETIAKAIEFVSRGGVLPAVDAPPKPSGKPRDAARPLVPAATADAPTAQNPCIDPVAVAAQLCRRFEGLYLTPYLCPAGIPTIGYGATYYEDGTPVMLSDEPITRERADALLLWMIKTVYMSAVLKMCPSVDTPERMAALIDFTFNVGSGRLRSSTMRRHVNDGNWLSARAELFKWIYGGGRALAGLRTRRAAEAALF